MSIPLVMRLNPQAGVTEVRTESGRRRRGRVGQEAVICNLGPVSDLSTAGMRVKCHRVPKGEFVAHLVGLGGEVNVRGRVAWVKRCGLFRKECGIQFMDVTPELARQITALGMTNRNRLTI